MLRHPYLWQAGLRIENRGPDIWSPTRNSSAMSSGRTCVRAGFSPGNNPLNGSGGSKAFKVTLNQSNEAAHKTSLYLVSKTTLSKRVWLIGQIVFLNSDLVCDEFCIMPCPPDEG